MRPLCYLAVPVAGILAVLVSHVVASQCRRDGFLETVALAFGAGSFLTLVFQAVVFVLCPLPRAEAMAYSVTNLLIYGSCLYVYANFVNMGETARRIRLLTELREAPGGLSREELLRRYNAQEIVTKRLDRLCITGQIERRGGVFVTRPSVMLRVARFVAAAKVFLLGKKEGFVWER